MCHSSRGFSVAGAGSAMSLDLADYLCPEKMLPMPVKPYNVLSMLTAWDGRGITCSLRAFIRAARMVHRALSRSNFAHSASVASAERANVYHISQMQ